MKRGVRRGLVAVAVAVLVLLALPAFADSQARIVRLSDLSGQVDIDRNAGQGFERAILNMPVTQGMELETGTDGRAEVEFEDGSTIRLTPETRISFPRLSLRASGAKVSVVDVREGAAYFEIRHKGDDEFTVAIGNRDFEVTRSSRFRVEFGDVDARVAVFKGELRTRGDGEEVAVNKNETLTLDMADGGRYELAQGIEASQYDQWDQQRSDYNDRYRDTDTYAQYGYNSNYSPYYGWSDLNYYGSFIDMPGYGYMWRPYGVSYMWDPFSDGAWVWYPSYGYTWVSYYPWGWAPYRYGSWVYVPSYGWCWRPATNWNAWYGVPRIYNPPTYWHRPTPPAQPNRPTVFVGRPVPPGAIGTGPIPRSGPPHRGSPIARPGAGPGVNAPTTVNPQGTVPLSSPSSGTQRGTGKPRVIDNDALEAIPARRGGIRLPAAQSDDDSRGVPVRKDTPGPSGIRPAPPTQVTPPATPTPRVSQPVPSTPRTPRTDVPRGSDRSTPRTAPSAPAPRPSMDRGSRSDPGPRMAPSPPPPSRPSGGSSRGPGRR